MAIQIGQQLGSHEITALIGRGGMGEVYRARDTKLKRDVAIKILPDEFARDADRASRFQREAESPRLVGLCFIFIPLLLRRVLHGFRVTAIPGPGV